MRKLFAFGAVVIASAACVSSPGGGSTTGAPPGPIATPRAQAAVPGCSLPALPFDVDDAADDDGTYLGRTVPLYPPALAGKELGRDSAWALDGVTLPQPSHHPLDLPVAAVVAQDGGDEGGTTAAGSIAIYYGAKGVQEGDTLLNVLAQPGAMLIVALSQGNDAKRVIGLLGDLATPIQIGSMDAVLTHSSAYANGVRAFELYWSDGRFDFSLLVNGSAREAIETAQSMYCG